MTVEYLTSQSKLKTNGYVSPDEVNAWWHSERARAAGVREIKGTMALNQDRATEQPQDQPRCLLLWSFKGRLFIPGGYGRGGVVQWTCERRKKEDEEIARWVLAAVLRADVGEPALDSFEREVGSGYAADEALAIVIAYAVSAASPDGADGARKRLAYAPDDAMRAGAFLIGKRLVEIAHSAARDADKDKQAIAFDGGASFELLTTSTGHAAAEAALKAVAEVAMQHRHSHYKRICEDAAAAAVASGDTPQRRGAWVSGQATR